jgi:hypothetical protein
VKPYEAAREIYFKESCPRTFAEDLGYHLHNGYVFSTPDFFLMGRPVCIGATYEEITDPIHIFPEHDAWFIYLAAGKGYLRNFLKLEPYALPYFGWERSNKIRFYPRERILRHV